MALKANFDSSQQWAEKGAVENQSTVYLLMEYDLFLFQILINLNLDYLSSVYFPYFSIKVSLRAGGVMSNFRPPCNRNTILILLET